MTRSSAITLEPTPVDAARAQSGLIGGSVRMLAPDGKTITNVGAGRAGIMRSLGYQDYTPELEQQKLDEIKYGGTLGEVGATALGVARGATLGLSDLAIRSGEKAGVLPQGTTDDVRKLEELNPNASLVGELGSFAIPALGAVKALGAAGKAAKAATAAQAVASVAGEKLGEVATKIVGKEIGKYAAPAVKLAAESAIFQAGHNISEESLANRDLTVESVFAHLPEAAILGAGIGAALPIGLRVAKSVATSDPVKWIAEKATSQTKQFFDPQRTMQLFSGAEGRSALLADEGAGRSFKGAVKTLTDEGAYKGGQVVVDESTGKLSQTESGAFLNREGMYQRFVGLKDKAGEVMGNAIKQADELAGASGKNPKSFGWTDADSNKILDDIIGYSKRAAINNATESKLVDVLAENAQKIKAAKTFEELHALRRGLDESITPKNWMNLANKEKEIVKNIRRIVSDKIEKGMAELDSQAPGLLDRWNNSNKLWGSLKTVTEALGKQINRNNANVNILGMRFRDIGIGSIGSNVFGPAGALLGVANKAIQTDQGLLLRAAVGEKLHALGWLQKVTDMANNKIGKALDSFIDVGTAVTEKPTASIIGSAKRRGENGQAPGIEVTTPAMREMTQQDWFARVSDELSKFGGNPQAYGQALDEQLTNLAGFAPKTSEGIIAKAVQVNAYLLSEMPKNPNNQFSMFSNKWKPADWQINQFRETVKVARDPLSLLQDLKDGTATRKKTQTVQTLYPEIYAQMVKRVQEISASRTQPITYEQRLRLNTLFPGAEPSMRLAAPIQTLYQQAQQEKQGGKYRAAGVDKSKFGSRYQTKTDALTAR